MRRTVSPNPNLRSTCHARPARRGRTRARPALAWPSLLTLALLAGCAPQRERFAPLPSPVLATRRPAPRPMPPLPPPPAPIPQTPRPEPPVARTPSPEAGWLPRGGISPKWHAIVVHHSTSPRDTPWSMDEYHRNGRGWANGLGYHFVIGNGVNYGDGEIFVGDRWKRQISGAHCANKPGKFFGQYHPGGYYNDHGIGICLVGHLSKTQPTPRQLESLRRLVAFLTDRCGIDDSHIYGHGHITRATECPGKNLSLSRLRRELSGITAASQ